MTRPRIRLLAGIALLPLALVACSSSSSGGGTPSSSSSNSSSPAASGNVPGVTATTVTIGSTQPETGVAAPGYSEIAKASNAYFQFINANGGVNGRTIKYTFVDDGYNPTLTLSQTQTLILQDHVFAIFNALGTPTHEKVVNFLNQQGVPDLFVASGCVCWDNVSQHPDTFGWQPDYIVEGKILGQYLKQNFAGKKIAFFYQNDDFGQGGVRGLTDELPASMIVSRQPYQPTNINVAPQVQALAASHADVVVSFSVPAFTALLKLNMLRVNYSPKLVVSNVGSDPITLAGLLTAFAKKGGANVNGNALTQGIITDGYLAPLGDMTNSWTALFHKIWQQYLASSGIPFDGNVEYGMGAAYTFAQALLKAGKNLTRDGIVKAVEAGLNPGPGLVPYRYSSTSHAGFTGVQIGTIVGSAIKLQGSPMTTDDTSSGAISAYTQAQQTAPSNGVPTG